MSKKSKILKEGLANLQSAILTEIKSIVMNRDLELHNPVVVLSDDQADLCIVTVNHDLTVDTDYDNDISTCAANVSDYDLEIQIKILEELENEKFDAVAAEEK